MSSAYLASYIYDLDNLGKFETLILFHFVFFAIYLILSFYIRFHIYIHIMALLFSILPFIISGSLLEHGNIADDTMIIFLKTIYISSVFIIYPLLTCLGAFINNFEKKVNIYKKPLTENQIDLRKTARVILVICIGFEIPVGLIISFLGGIELAFIVVLWYGFLPACYYLISKNYNALHVSICGIRSASKLKIKTEHIVLFIAIFLSILYFNHIYEAGVPGLESTRIVLQFSFLAVSQILGLILIRYLIGMMREYRPFILIIIPTIIVYGLFAIYIFKTLSAT